MNLINYKNYFLLLLLSLVLAIFSIGALSQTDEGISDSDNDEESESIKDKDEMVPSSKLRKCLMKAKSMKDKKNCEKENMPTVEEFIEDEELELTQKRDVLAKKEFNALADDFDKRVQKTRNFYDLKDSQLRDSLEKWKKNFIELSGRIIQPIMINYQAFIVLDSSQIDLFFDNRIDITEQVILELDELYKSDPKYLEVILGK